MTADDMPSLKCSWSGLATAPGFWVMMNGMCGKGVLIHEMGHNYGLDHSNVLTSTGVSIRLATLHLSGR